VSPWIIALVIIAALMWISPFGLIVGIVLISTLLMMHPTIAIAIAAWVAMFICIAIYQRRRGRAF